jgi:protein-tyrosine phosphatase
LQKKRNKEESSSGGSDGEGQVGMRKLELNDEGDNAWLDRDDEDLICKVVGDFRDQRLSMVQSLRQFVLCYETVLEWFARQSPLDSGKRKA